MAEAKSTEDVREVHIPAAGVPSYDTLPSERVEAARWQAAESYRAEIRQLTQMRLFDNED